MPKQWEADIHFTERDAARLIEQQFPELAPAHLAPSGVGWDNAAFLVNGRFMFRFPHRRAAAYLLEREVKILPLLAPHLPLRTTAPEYVGAPTAGYPYVFAGYTLLPGQTADRRWCSEGERAKLASPLACFLRRLHTIPLDAATLQWAPRDEFAKTDTRGRAPKLKEQILTNAARLDAHDVERLVALVEDLAPTPGPAREPRWVHGDLYARHLVLDEACRLVGLIDWGDVHVGDPATDLSIAFSFLPPGARQRFRQEYGEIDDATWRRARFRALIYGAILVEYGADIADPALRALGEYTLRHAPVDEEEAA
jgi:aminoglycoside phosphotransferase (APT) family kinase protein